MGSTFETVVVSNTSAKPTQIATAGDPPQTLYNPSATDTIYISDSSSFNVSGTNYVSLPPGAATTIQPITDVYAAGSGNNDVLEITPGGVNFINPPSLSSLGGSAVYVQATAPTGSIPVNSLWFDTANGSLATWNGSAWVTQQFNAQQLIQVATILSAQVAASAGILGSQLSATADIAGSQLSASAGIIGSQLSAAAGIVGGQLANNTITASKVANGTLTTTQLAAAAGILGAQIAAATITSGNIAANTIVAANIAANTITASQLAAGIIYAGIVDGTTITGAHIVADGTSGNILVYSGTPALNNLIASVSPNQFTDSLGNLVLRGLTSYFDNAGTFLAVQLFDGAVIFSKAAAAGGPYTQTGAIQEQGTGLIISDNASPVTLTADSNANLYALELTSGGDFAVNHSGSALAYLDRSLSDATVIPVGSTTTLTRITKQYSIIANDPNVGTCYRITFGGVGTMGSTAVTLRFNLNVNGSVFAAILTTATLFAAGNGFRFNGYCELHFSATGSAGNVNVIGGITLHDTSTGNAVTYSLSDQTNAYNTTVAGTVEIDFQWGATSTGETISNLGSNFERIGL